MKGSIVNLTPDISKREDSATCLHPFDICYVDVARMMETRHAQGCENLDWLYKHMPSYFFITMRNEINALTNLIMGMRTLDRQRGLVLADEAKKLIVARLDVPGSLYDTLMTLSGRDISYSEIIHSRELVPGTTENLEVLRFEFDRKRHEDMARVDTVRIPAAIRENVLAAMRSLYPGFGFKEFNRTLNLLWLNMTDYVRLSPPERVARVLWLYQQGVRNEGMFLDVEPTDQVVDSGEYRILFSVEDLARPGFLTQAMEVFKRLRINLRRAYSLNITNGTQWYFLGNYYVSTYDGQALTRTSDLFMKLKTELYNTQILSTESGTYRAIVKEGLMSGEDASLVNAMAAFCQTTLSHYRPDRFDSEAVNDALLGHPDIASRLVDLFKKRFDPRAAVGSADCKKAADETEAAIEAYNTGHKHLDEVRRMIYRTCFLFITRTLKTNFHVTEKHALAFRLDPSYLTEIAPDFMKDLPSRMPFRVSFFFGRLGVGYHVGFSDIARGGWRTIICSNQDELVTNSNNLFREVFVLAHTQHLKNKDIYEGGSKLVVTFDAREMTSPEEVTQQLHKMQYAFLNAFLDIFVTENGHARDPRIVDYYGDDEPIELGPDENMHDSMIEIIARQAVKRGYLLGSGIMSSKRVGINHKEYGVTSRGVLQAASTAMKQVGIDMAADPFSVKLTGGPYGDVAGNCIRFLLEQCPKVRITAVVDASGALHDPEGADAEALERLVHQEDIGAYAPEALHPGAMLLLPRQTRREGLKVLTRKLVRTDSGIEEFWVTADEYHREVDELVFRAPADLFLPCGGRPETIDACNWPRFFIEDNRPSAGVVVEGANSFISPEARIGMQKGGVIIVRDSSANKCGVIASSYEIIANLIMSDQEFLKHKEVYVRDVLELLKKRAEDEASLIFRRYREADGKVFFTDISAGLSEEINDHYDRLFAFFQQAGGSTDDPSRRKALLQHMPALVRENTKLRNRALALPAKIKSAILAAEIASSIVYHGGWDDDFAGKLERYLEAHFN